MNATFRDIALFVVGMAGIAHETLISAHAQQSLLIVFAAMVGLPFVIRGERKNGNATS